MKCTVNDLQLSFDNNGQLRTTLGRLSKWDVNKAYALASFLKNDGFKKYLSNSLRPEDIHKGAVVDINNIQETDYVNINQNKFGSLLNAYYIDHYHSVENSKTLKGDGYFNGFSSISAKKTAIVHVSNIILNEYLKEANKPVRQRRNVAQIVADVNNILLNNFYENVDLFVQQVEVGKYSKNAKEYAEKYKAVLNRITKLESETTSDTNRINEIASEIKELKSKLNNLGKAVKKNGGIPTEDKNCIDIANQIKRSQETIKSIRSAIENRNKSIALESMNRYVMAQNLVSLYTSNYDAVLSTRLKNYANLVAQSRGDTDAWYFQVFHTKTLTNFTKDFNRVDSLSDMLETIDESSGDITDQYNEENIDETTKIWDEILSTDFSKYVGSKVKLILSTLPNLSEKFNSTDEVQAIDTNNELGVSTYMDTQFVITQLYTACKGISVEDMIDKIEKHSSTSKELYGLGRLADMMKKDDVFANLIFTTFQHPIFKKSMLTISDKSIKIDYSNKNNDPVTSLVYKMSNNIRATFNTAYNQQSIQDIDTALDSYKRATENYDKEKRNQENLLKNKSTDTAFVKIAEQTSQNAFNEMQKKKLILQEALHKMLSSYFPMFDKNVVTNILDNTSINNIEEIETFVHALRDLQVAVEHMKINYNDTQKNNNITYNKKYKEYIQKLRQWQFLSPAERQKTPAPVKPTREFIDVNNIEFTSALYSSLFDLSNIISKYTSVNVQLNSTNAAGNQSSDVGDNCYVSRLFEQINAETEEDSEAGLKSLLEYVTQGIDVNDPNSVNQYSNNPLLFGVKNQNGVVIRQGLFTRTTTGFVINKNAKNILKYNLFNGVKNNTLGGGQMFDTMSSFDFLASQFIAFQQSISDITKTNIGEIIGNPTNDNSAVYSMRIGSDAPKIFFIRAPKYSNKEVTMALHNHLTNELNMFVKGLNGLFEHQSSRIINGRNADIFTLRSNIDNLIPRVFYDEKIADQIRRRKGKDFTRAFVKDGKLLGNIFKFNKLCLLNGYNAGNEIEKMLSLYEESFSSPLIGKNENGETILITNDVIKWDQSSNSFIVDFANIQSQMNTIIGNWVNTFLAESKTQLGSEIDLMKNLFKEDSTISVSNEAFDNFLLNQYNMNLNYDDLFEGDSKFYKNPRDVFKRMKESQAGGDAYAGYNVLDNDKNIKNVVKNGAPITINIKSVKNGTIGEYTVPTYEGGKIVDKPMTARTGWRGVTVYNTTKPSEYANDLQKQLEEQYIQEGFSKQDAHKLSVQIAEGFGYSSEEQYGSDTTINDAQSYITLEEFIRRRWADGTLNDYQDLIAQLLDPDVSANEIDLSQINARIQAQKNFYYDKVFDADTGLYYPRQIKNAEFVLVPKLFPENSELRKVYDFMRKHDIGQLNTVETSKAAKKSILRIWDEETGAFNENFEDEFQDSQVEDYSYKYLYKQLDVNDHIKEDDANVSVQVVKRILDNIVNYNTSDSERQQLQQWAKEFQNTYSKNIQESFYLFCDSMGWAVEENTGRIINKNYATTDSDGNALDSDIIDFNKYNLDFSELYKRGLTEAARLGLDSNVYDYFVLGDNKEPTMPNWISVQSKKIESIMQSIFNKNITKQTLPGWHCAQVTSVGYSDKLHFDPKTGIMEVYLPKWSDMLPETKTKEEEQALLKQLQEEGLDLHIAHRSPCEGHQSISVLRVVGFVNEALGSTIIVPDEWITQTGSDFDIDTVYGFRYAIDKYTDENGVVQLKKHPFEEDTVNNEDLYIQYVNTRINTRNDIGSLSDEVAQIKSEVKTDLEALIEENKQLQDSFNGFADEEKESYSKLPTWAKGLVKSVMQSAPRVINDKSRTVVNIEQAYPNIKKILESQLAKRPDGKVKERETALIKDYCECLDQLLNVMSVQKGVSANIKSSNSRKTNAFNEAKEKYFKSLENLAISKDLLSFEEFKNLPLIDRLDKKGRDNLIVDRMIKIMSHPYMKEEQYSRSNFDDIINGENGANDIVDALYQIDAAKQSSYNPVHQLINFNDAQSGARLKAISVNWDTFVSKNNILRTNLSEWNGINVVLPVDGNVSARRSNITYNEKIILSSYENDAVLIKEKAGDVTESVEGSLIPASRRRIVLTARNVGWSTNNRNVIGKLITSYTSQTTAHQLDAIKMGSIPNINDYTFNVYKLISALGIDFEFAVSFMRQPAITEIVNAYNDINSVFIDDNMSNPIKMGIIRIANRYGFKVNGKAVSQYTKITDIISTLQQNKQFCNTFKLLFNDDISAKDLNDILDTKVPLDKQQLFTRIENEANGVSSFENFVFDIAMALNFRNFNNIAKQVNNCILATSVDHGTKKSIWETRKIVENINEARKKNVLLADGTNVIDLMFPLTLGTTGSLDVAQSQYKPLASIVSSSILPSIDIGSKLFVTENYNWVALQHLYENILGRKFNEDEYNQFKQFSICSLYNENNKLMSPLTVDERGHIISDESVEEEDYWNHERSRILGYGIVAQSPIQIKDINNPTKEEIDAFNKLTPVQKVLFIQKNFEDNQGIFKYILTTSSNITELKWRGITRQYLQYDDQVNDIEILYNLFSESFYNKNPLLKLACIDLVKYAYISEGFQFKKGYISKIIPNSVLYTSIENGGFDIISDFKSQIQGLHQDISSIESIEKFFRGHSELTKITKFSRGREETNYFMRQMRGDGLVHLNTAINTSAANTIMIGIANKLDLANNVWRFVRITTPINEKGYRTTLFKIEGRNSTNEYDNRGNLLYKDYFLIPLNELDTNEISDYSYNEHNNIWNEREYYTSMADQIAEDAEQWRDSILYDGIVATEERVREAIRDKNKPVRNPVGKYTNSAQFDITTDKNVLLNIQEGSANAHLKGGVDKLLTEASAYFTPVEGSLNNETEMAHVVLNNNEILSRMFPAGKKIVQTIRLNNGEFMDVAIAKHYTKYDKVNRNNFLQTLNKLYDGTMPIERHSEYVDAIKEMKDRLILPENAILYRITPVQKSSTEVNDQVRNATTDLIVDPDSNPGWSPLSERKSDNIDSITVAMINDISYKARKTGNNKAEQFIRSLEKDKVNTRQIGSIREKQGNIYVNAARYYESMKNSLLNALESFDIAGETYSLDDAEFYEKLKNNEEYVPQVIKLILDTVTFGDQIKEINNIDLTKFDDKTKKAIENIIDNIATVKNNNIVKIALDNIFNIYLAKFSTNSDIRNGIIKLRDSFGDTDWLSSWIANAAEIESSEVQVVLKQIYSHLDQAQVFQAPKNVKAFRAQYDDIMKMDGEFDMHHVVNANGQLTQDFNDDYLNDLEAVRNKYNNARVKKDESFEAYKEYIKAKYEYDLFKYKYTEQPIVADYYRRKLQNEWTAMTKAGDIYYEYKILCEQRSKIGDPATELTEKDAALKKAITQKIKNLTSEVNEIGEPKSMEESVAASILSEYIKENQKINEEFFDRQEYEGFQQDYERYKRIVDKYNSLHPNQALEDKLADPDFKEAYDWIANNGLMQYGKEEQEQLKKAFKLLRGRTTSISAKTIQRLKNVPGAIDKNGQIDGRKLTDEQLAVLKKEEEAELINVYGRGVGEGALINERPDDLPVGKKKNDNKSLDDDEFTNVKEKEKLVEKINEILGKALDRNTGRLDIQQIFDDNIISANERKELASLFKQLRNLRKRPFKEGKTKLFERKINWTAFNRALSFYSLRLMNTAQGRDFLNILVEEVDSQGNLIPNTLIYGYTIPTNIDTERTDAIKYIKDNVEFVPNEYYYYAREEAIKNNTYSEWFEKNHIYNPYNHRYEPLRIWTTMTARPGSSLGKSLRYIPTFANTESSVKKDKVNKNYKKHGYNYKTGDKKYDNPVVLTQKERAVRQLFAETLDKYSTSYKAKYFAARQFMPRVRKTHYNIKWALSRLASLVGLRKVTVDPSKSWTENVDYSHDKDVSMDMMSLLRGKGSKEYLHMPEKGNMSDAEYQKVVNDVRKKNKEIEKQNQAIDASLFDDNWLNVMEEFINDATVIDAREKIKPLMYLLIEELKTNKSYNTKFGSKKLKRNSFASTDDYTTYQMQVQENRLNMIQNLARRIIYSEYHKESKLRSGANLMQSLTSAKYMIFNVFGGIANVFVGEANIANEAFAGEYFGKMGLTKATAKYTWAMLNNAIKHGPFKNENLSSALMKKFEILDLDYVLGTQKPKGLDKVFKKIGDSLYILQTGGEHFMQNRVLLAMLGSNRLYRDINGNLVIGDFKEYSNDIEKQAMIEVLGENSNLYANYKAFLSMIKNNPEFQSVITRGTIDINRFWLHSLRDNNTIETRKLYKKISKEYHKKRDELLATAKKEFEKNKTVENMFEFRDGEAVLKKEVIDDIKDENAEVKLEKLLAEFKNKVFITNQKIHGVYDKRGAGMIESKALGSIAVQYHKHLYTNLAKRWRPGSYYSEFRGSKEHGSYLSAGAFFLTEFIGMKDRINGDVENGSYRFVAAVGETLKAIFNTVFNIKMNWNNLSIAERANIKRNLGDIVGATLCLLGYCWVNDDDDDDDDDIYKAIAKYLFDRMYSEITMYTPFGMVTEFQTLWASPIAAQNHWADLLDLAINGAYWLTDPNFSTTYKSGQNRKKNKFEVLLRRNMPGVRVYDRIKNINNYNSYYKPGKTMVGLKAAKGLYERLNTDNYSYDSDFDMPDFDMPDFNFDD